MEVKKIAEKEKIWNEREEVAKSEAKAKKLISQRFYKWIHIFGKKVSERMPTKKGNRSEERVCAEERESISIVNERERKGV